MPLTINTDLARQILTGFIRSEITRMGFHAGGDRPFRRDRFAPCPASWRLRPWARRMCWRCACPTKPPRRIRSDHAQLVIDHLGARSLTIPITEMVDPLIDRFPEMQPCARATSWRACA